MRADIAQRATWADEWLRSDDSVHVAWGAWLARHDEHQDLIPALLRKVEDYQPLGEPPPEERERDRHDATLVVLDALIGLHAAVAPTEARKLYPEFPAQSVILLVRSPRDAQSALLEVFDNATANWTWLAAGNVLIKDRTAGFAARLLTRLKQHLTLSIVDSGVGSGVFGGGSECGFSARPPKEGWPPVGLYLLTQFPERIPAIEAIFLVGGETAVYYLRVGPGNYDNPSDVPGSCDDGNRDVYRTQYLKELAEPSIRPFDLDAYPRVTIEWKGEDTYRKQLFAEVEQRQAEFQRAVRRLLELGTLTTSETADLKPRIEIVVRDQDRPPCSVAEGIW